MDFKETLTLTSAERENTKVEEYSRIQIEEYCMEHNSKKSLRLWELVNLSYNIEAEATDDDAIFLENIIRREKDPELKKALQDLDDYLFRY